MDDKTFKYLINQVDKNKCVLVLGPEFVNIDNTDATYNGSIHDYLGQNKFKDVSEKNSYISEDGFFYYNEPVEKYTVLEQIGEYYKSLPLTDTYKKIAEIPFYMIISLSPDDLISQAYDALGKKYTMRSYKSSGFEEAPSVTGKEDTLIYNLLGHYNDSENLVFTFDDLFKFLNKIFQDNVFPKFREHINTATSFLFFGFSYDKWYLKLIFFLLKKFRTIDPQNYTKNAIFNYNAETSDTRVEFYKSNFDIKFSPEKEKDFIEKLHAASKEKYVAPEKISSGTIAATSAAATDNRYKILFLGASPEGIMPLKLWDEYNKIKSTIKEYNSDTKPLLPADKQKDFFVSEPIYRTTVTQLMKEVNKEIPRLIYLSMHGGEDGKLIFSDANDQPVYLELSELLSKIKTLAVKHDDIECIVFSSCESEEQAKQISTVIPYCVGMKEAIDPQACVPFADGFFSQLVNDTKDVGYAFKMGVESMKDNDFGDLINIPVLYFKGELINT